MGWKRQWKASIRTRPVRSAAATMERACAVLDASGFSHRTWWPASSAAIVHFSWRLFISAL